MKGIVTALLSGGALLGALLVVGQSPFAASVFEYQQYREYMGVVEDWPYPMLITASGPYLLVAPGKHGASVSALRGPSVKLRGALIQRDGQRMLEILPDSIREASASWSQHAPAADLGPVSLTGEIVDTKCYLGVMNPGNGKVHRDCAVRCISGGVPPGFLVRDASGQGRVLLLAGADGRALHKEVLEFAAEPIRISGRLVHSGSQLVLKAEPTDFRRLE